MDRLLTDLGELLDIPAVGGTPDEARAQHWVSDTLRSWGWEVDVWTDDPAAHRTDPAYPGMEVARSSVTGVIGRPPGSRGTHLVLGHTDVVPGGPSPAIDARSIRGRGAVDMKSGLVAGMHAARAAGGDVAVCAVSGEEDGGIGAFLALKHGLRAQVCVIPEPTSLAIIPANAGSLTFRLTLPGVSAHGARRWDGHNALEGLPDVMSRLQTLEADRNTDVPDILSRWPLAYPISIGRIEGGDWPSTVMGQVRLEGRYGVKIGEPLAAAMQAFEQALTGTGASVEWFGGRFASGSTDPAHPVVQRLAAAHRAVTGGPPEIFGATYGSDLRQVVAAGIPTVQYGPGDAALAHGEDEEVSVDEVRTCRDVLTAWLRGTP